MVQKHLVKLIGWCHNKWGNTSNLKGGVGPLEALAQAVSDKKQEADEHMKHIEVDEILTPNKVDQEPEESYVIPIDDDNAYKGNSIGGSANQTDHFHIPMPSSPTIPTHNNDLGPAPLTTPPILNISTPSLPLATPSPPLATPSPPLCTPSPPLATTPSRSHMEPHLPNTQLPIGNLFIPTPSASNTTTVALTNHTQYAIDRVLLKWKRKPTEKAAL
ncbi:hypothetical protein BD769DRAFT_1387673 [Suillus cothurnatus]|nr:hypothetical protein BD769DRAFT_1387673 [Suillus cothurnatus]